MIFPVGSNPQGIRRFKDSEDGTVTIFGILMFVLMVVIGGVAIDIMRYETQRVQLQNTVDRAVLAAAALNQSLPPEDVVESYLEAAGLDGYRLRFQDGVDDVDERMVSIMAEMDINTMFMHFFGIRALTTPAYSAAEQGAQNVEISLVLDISGSMRNELHNSLQFERRIDALRFAATELTNSVVGTDDTGLTSINLVPYAGHVNPGPAMFNYLGGNRFHSDSSCLEFNAGDFHTEGLPTGVDQVPHFMNWPFAPDFMEWGWCPDDNATILYGVNDANQLEDYIQNIRLHDGTGTHIGMSYGLALLSPTSQAAFQSLYYAGEIDDSRIAARPAEWFDPDTQKFIILMTDGLITDQFRPNDALAEINHSVALQNQPDRPRYTQTSRDENFERFSEICDVARGLNVVVFAVSFETTDMEREMMRNCATSDAHFYDTQGEGLVMAFRSIAAAINHLRLTQ